MGGVDGKDELEAAREEVRRGLAACWAKNDAMEARVSTFCSRGETHERSTEINAYQQDSLLRHVTLEVAIEQDRLERHVAARDAARMAENAARASLASLQDKRAARGQRTMHT